MHIFAKISQLQSLEFKQKKKKHQVIHTSIDSSTDVLESIGTKVPRMKISEIKRSQLGVFVNFSLFPYRGFTLKKCWGLRLAAPNIQFAYADFYTVYTPFVSLIRLLQQSRSQSMRKGYWKSSNVGKFAKKKIVKSKKIGWHSTSTTTCQKNGQSLFTSNSIIRNHSPIPRTSGEDVVYNECVRSRELCQVITYLWKFGPTNFPSNHYRKFASYSGRVSQYYPLEMEFSRRPREYSPFFCFYLNVYMILHVL